MDFGISSSAGNESCVETVRALHQTILALKTALEKSRSEILELKSQNWSIDNAVEDTIKNLSIENHILRQNVVNNEAEDSEKKRKESKQKKVKRKHSNEKIFVKKECQEAECNRGVLSEKNRSRNAYRSLENISTGNIQRKVSKTKNQLTKSKTIYFSNVFEGENQISTTNSLHIRAPNTQKIKISKEHKDSSKCENKDLKSHEDLNFKEEPINDKFIVSRRGSITDFETDGHISFSKDLKQSKKYSEYVKKSEQLVKSSRKAQNNRTDDWEAIKCQKTSAVSKGNIIDKKQHRKREETFIKKQLENQNGDRSNDFIPTQKTKRKSSNLGKEIETALIQQAAQHPDKLPTNVNLKEIEKSQSTKRESKLNNVFSNLHEKPKKYNRESEKDQLKVTNIELDQIQSNKSGEVGEKTIIKTIENQISNESGVVTKDSENLEDINKENLLVAGNELDQNLCEIKEGAIETVGGSEDYSLVKPSDSQVKVSETPTIQEEKPQNSKETNKKSDKQQNSVEFNEKNSSEGTNIDGAETNENPDKDPLENSSEVTVNSSEPSTNSLASQKNVEISVKIYKGSKKPIEIDIQTKKNRHKSKTSNKHKKMNNKSQNTSFDKEYGDSPSNPATTNEIRRHIESATANNIVTNILQNDVEQEVDDIELIFTTDDTKDTDFKEELVPIDAYAETQLLQCPLSDYEEKLSAETSDRELEDDVFNDNFENENQENCNFQSQTYDFRRENSQIYNSKSDNSINHEDKSLKSYYSYQDSSFENKSLEKDESFDRFEEKTRIIETDISKIGIQDLEYNTGRRNTCPNPIQYRPIMHREALGRGISSSRKCRPILAHSNVIRKESGAQTDISALPGSSWRSESSLGHKAKVGENFTTLPSKFPHPGSRLRLSEKTVEARRVLLSDIGFTSMVPELSRSADHLCPPVVRGPVVSSYGQFLRTTDLYSPAYTSQKFVWTTTTPSEGSHSQSRYSSQYPLSPPVPTRRCSAPVSPSKKAATLKSIPSKVRFANGSLPELRGDWTATVDSGESTDSLVEEAEHFLRRSIDCLAPCKDICLRSETVKMSGVRRASAPEPTRDNVPPQGWQPFLPRIPRDLHLDYWVKVISPEGRVRGGRVRYVGPLMNQSEAFVGVQLSTPDGHSDGTYSSRRYFNCEPYHGLFVPFKKIIMGWRP